MNQGQICKLLFQQILVHSFFHHCLAKQVTGKKGLIDRKILVCWLELNVASLFAPQNFGNHHYSLTRSSTSFHIYKIATARQVVPLIIFVYFLVTYSFVILFQIEGAPRYMDMGSEIFFFVMMVLRYWWWYFVLMVLISTSKPK